MDNAEGSSQSKSFSFKQQAVLAGTILGDGCLAGHGQFHRLHIKHKLDHRALLEFKYEAFREFISMRPHYSDQKLGGRCFPCASLQPGLALYLRNGILASTRTGRRSFLRELL